MQAATEQQIALLQHTLGLSEHQRAPYRNYFVAGPGHQDMPDLEALESLGLMGRARTPAFCDQSAIVFCTTDAGRALALEKLPEPPKRTRYGEYLDLEVNCSFGEFLCGARLPKMETKSDFRKVDGRWRYVYQHRMYRRDWGGVYGHYNDVEGQWAGTKKEAKASYKEALKAFQQARRAPAQIQGHTDE